MRVKIRSLELTKAGTGGVGEGLRLLVVRLWSGERVEGFGGGGCFPPRTVFGPISAEGVAGNSLRSLIVKVMPSS